jgi:hypothetical protein
MAWSLVRPVLLITIQMAGIVDESVQIFQQLARVDRNCQQLEGDV